MYKPLLTLVVLLFLFMSGNPALAQENQEIATPEEEPSFLETSLAYTINGFSEGLQRLGLKEINQLVFQQGQNQLIWGTFNQEEMANIIRPWHGAFKGLAWGMTVLALILGGTRLAGSAINPEKRVSLMTMIQNWLIAAILLTFIMFFLEVLFSLNTALLQDFIGFNNQYSFTEFKDLTEVSLAQAVIKLTSVGLTLWINLIYLARRYALMVLVILAPVFCHFWYYQKTRHLTGLWFREVFANVIMQSVHGFMLGLFFSLNMADQEDWLVKLGFLIVFIPTSDMVRRLLTGTGGQGMLSGAMMGLGMGSLMGLAGIATRGHAPSNGGKDPQRAFVHPAFQDLKVTQGSNGVSLFRSAAGNIGAAIGGLAGSAVGTGLGNPLMARTLGESGSRLGRNVAAAGGGVIGAGISLINNGLKVEPDMTGADARKVRIHNLAHLAGQAMAGNRGSSVASQMVGGALQAASKPVAITNSIFRRFG